MTQIIPSRGGGGGVGLYKYMGTVDYYEDLPTSGMKVGDTYNVVNAHTTAPEFPAGANLAWNGTEWDVLGGTFDLSEYQKKLVEGDGIDIDSDTNVISVESSIIEGAAAGATAVQPGDDVSTLNNDAGYIDKDVNDLTYYTKSSDLAAVATSGKYCDLSGTPTIGNGKLNICRNGSCLITYCANQTSDSGVDINVPTKTSDIQNDSGYIDKTVNDLDNYTLSSNLCTVATSGSYTDLSNKPTIGTGVLTIQKNGTDVNTFGANATSNVTANITVPTTVAELTDSSDYAKTSSLCDVATSGKYCDLTGTPTIPTDNCELANGCGYITGINCTDVTTALGYTPYNSTNPNGYTSCTGTLVASDLTPYAKSCDLKAVATSGKYCDLTGTPALCTVATSGKYCDLTGTPTIPTVIDNLTSTSTTNALSANQGKALKDMIDDLSALGKFLSLWDSTTGLPISFPQATPYTYSTGDYFLVETVGTTNYKPTGSSYTGTASTTVETDEVDVGDIYIYDGTTWLLQINHGKTVSFANLSGSPEDNTALSCALGDKQDVCNLVTTLSGADDTHYPSAKAVADALSCAGAGDMLKSVYDPNNCNTDAFNYNNLYNKPTIPTDNCQLANSCGYTTCTGTLVASDLTPYATTASLCAVATSGKYCDLTGRPSLCTVATSGKYCDLTGTPTIPTNNNQLTNGCGYTTCTGTLVASDLTPYAKTCDLATVATSGKYCDLTGTPTLCAVATSGKYCDLSGQPTIGTATLSICRNCTLVNSFGANATSNISVNIDVPTDTCELSNSAGFITGISCTDVTTALGYTPYSNANPNGYTTCTGTLTQSAISDTAFAASWDGDTTHAPSKNAVYDKINAMCVVPSGGTEGQVLTQTSGGTPTWQDVQSGGGGGGYICSTCDSPAARPDGAQFAIVSGVDSSSYTLGGILFDRSDVETKQVCACAIYVKATNDGQSISTCGCGTKKQVAFFGSAAPSHCKVGYVDVLVVGAGGNGGACYQGHGGGAGGVLYCEHYPIFSYTGYQSIRVGAPQPQSKSCGQRGGNSSFGNLLAVGGGNGGWSSYTQSYCDTDQSSGGSGAGHSCTGGGWGIDGQGYRGGQDTIYGDNGGGGGAGGVGGDAVQTGCKGGNGGIGIINSISGSNQCYGGGGGGYGRGSNGQGSYGGGNACSTGNGGNATTYGSGGGATCSGYCGGQGCQGVVILRYHTDGSDGICCTSSGGCKYTCGVYTIHCFKNTGLIDNFIPVFK